MICHKYKCIFVHNPKCGGTSIIDSFGKAGSNPDRQFLLNGVVSPMEQWDKYHLLYKNYFVFSVVRNPWDKFISGWKYCPGTKEKELADVLSNLPSEGHDYVHVKRTQHCLLYNENKLIANYLIRFEDLQGGFDHVCDIIEKPRIRLLKLNATEHKHYTSYFNNPSDRQLFEDNFKIDIDAFNYKYDDIYIT